MATKEAAPDAPNPIESVEDWFAGIGDTGKTISVFRRRTDGTWEFCGNLPVQGFTPSVVKDYYGGGDFDLRAYGPSTKSNSSGYLGRVGLAIAGPPKSEDPDGTKGELARERKAREAAEDRAREAEKARGEDRIAAALGEIRDFMREVRNPPPQAATADPFKMAVELVTHLSDRMEPHVQQLPQAPVTDPMAITTAILETFRMGMEMGAMGSGEGGGYMDVINRLGMPLMRILDRMSGGNGAVEMVTAGDGAQGAPQPEAPQTLKDVLAQWTPTITTWAASGANPELRADLVVDELPDTWLDELEGLLRTEGAGAITRVLGWFPDLMPHRVWVQRFLDRLSADLIEPEPGSGDGVEIGTRSE